MVEAQTSGISRRGFMVIGGGGVLSSLFQGNGPLSRGGQVLFGPGDPAWRPSPELLRSLPRMLELAAVPGLALGTVENGAVWNGGFGRASNAQNAAVSKATVFEAVSLGKPVFAYAVLRLVDRGTLDLNRPLFDYLPIDDGNNERMRRVTAAHVLSHSTGLPNWREQPGPLIPASEPGTTFSYSGEAYYYLQRVIESVTGRPFARLMREEVLDPLGMPESSYVWMPQFSADKAAGRDEHGTEADEYGIIGRKTEEIAEKWGKPLTDWRYEDALRAVPLVNPAWPVLPLYLIPNAAGSLLTTVNDYTRFLTRLVARAPSPGLDLSSTIRAAMITPRTRLNRVLSWGLGWGIQRDQHGEVLWHWGANNSFRNFVLADPAGGRAVVVFTNSESGPKVYERVITAVTGHDQAAFLFI
jgi:CubicO group peptidase (beta-lactamase class C family)